ncbi:Inactive histone-lysine N-methyltransferase 2E [Taenia crassiceps]|uniref:Inactive histone-lysine N-methyltransferase 2E n=1 Tax=Taenia crassiceps TaxID=6207 RepID=A0ABR4QMU4_9CEST
MDIAAEETSSPLQGFKYVKPFSNFFQAAKQRFANLDPESGVHLVGPMFELTACIDKEKRIQDFDALYPETGVSFGPTICSFGLPYNDHNYALPVGLTPPTMAPHLMDVNFTHKPPVLTIPLEIAKPTAEPKSASGATAVVDVDENGQDSFQSRSLIKTKGVKTSSAISSSSSKVVSPPTKVTPLVFASIAESTAGLSESKKTLFAAWHAKAAASGGTLLVQQRWKVQESDQQSAQQQHQQQAETLTPAPVKDQVLFSVPRYCKSVTKESEGERVYLESDMKIIEVPEDLCVSPSKLSSLESSDQEDSDTETSNIPGQSSRRSAADPGPKPAIWSTVNCLCEVKVGDSRMLQCLNCRYLQHMECMEIVYEEGASTDEADLKHVTPKEKLLDPSVYLCPSCLRPAFTVRPEVVERVLTASKQRESAKQLNLLSLIHHHAGKSEVLKHPIGGAQLLANATDRARQLGLIGGSSAASVSRNTTFPNTDERHKMNCLERQNNETTDVNRRIPSPPRASKRKQDLTTTSYDVEAMPASSKAGVTNEPAIQESPSSTLTSQTPSTISTPADTPVRQIAPFQLSYHHHMKIYSADGTVDRSPCSPVVTASSESTPVNSPMPLSVGSSRKKQKISAFGDSPLRLSMGRRGNVVGSTLGSAWAKDYKEADVSFYSENLLTFVAQRIASGRERVQRLPPTCLGRTPLCRVVMFDHNDKGLEASARLGKGEVVTEIRGNLMLLEEYEHFIDPINYYNRYVMIYHNFGDRAVAINTFQYGNDARFIRRSCIPNCFLDHFIVCNKLRIIIRTTQELMPGVELTIPFDFDYRSCRYTVKCACARSRCPVQKWCRKLARHKVMPYLDYGKFIESRLNALSKPITEEQSPTTPSSTRTYSTENSPAPVSSTQKASLTPLIPASATCSPQRFVSSTKRPLPSARLFTTPIANIDTSGTTATETTTAPKAAANDDTPSPTEEPPPAKKRPLPSHAEAEEKKGSTKGDRSSSRPFEPIITTRRQAARAAAAAAAAAITPTTTSSYEGVTNYLYKTTTQLAYKVAPFDKNVLTREYYPLSTLEKSADPFLVPNYKKIVMDNARKDPSPNNEDSKSRARKLIISECVGPAKPSPDDLDRGGAKSLSKTEDKSNELKQCRDSSSTQHHRKQVEASKEELMKRHEAEMARRMNDPPCDLPGTYMGRIGTAVSPDWQPRDLPTEAERRNNKKTIWERATDLPKPTEVSGQSLQHRACFYVCGGLETQLFAMKSLQHAPPMQMVGTEGHPPLLHTATHPLPKTMKTSHLIPCLTAHRKAQL